MATLITQVDRTIGTYQDVFIYTINASFNGIVNEIHSAKIKVFFPNSLNIYLGDVKNPVQDVQEESVVGGTNLIFNFGAIEELGVAIRLGVGVTFKNTVASGSTYLAIPELWVNGEKY